MLSEQTEVPQLDERLWRVWRERDEAKYRQSRKRVIVGFMAVAVIILTLMAIFRQS